MNGLLCKKAGAWRRRQAIVPTEAFLVALEEAVQRGVRVRCCSITWNRGCGRKQMTGRLTVASSDWQRT
jgi:hypothetical protein